MSETDLWAWSWLTHVDLNTELIIIIIHALSDCVSIHPHQGRSAGTELWESQLSEGHVAQHQKSITILAHTHTQLSTRSSQHRHARMFFHSITDSPDTLPWSPTQSCTSLHHKVLCLQLKEVVYLHKQVSKTKTNGLHVSPHHTSHAV